MFILIYQSFLCYFWQGTCRLFSKLINNRENDFYIYNKDLIGSEMVWVLATNPVQSLYMFARRIRKFEWVAKTEILYPIYIGNFKKKDLIFFAKLVVYYLKNLFKKFSSIFIDSFLSLLTEVRSSSYSWKEVEVNNTGPTQIIVANNGFFMRVFLLIMLKKLRWRNKPNYC